MKFRSDTFRKRWTELHPNGDKSTVELCIKPNGKTYLQRDKHYIHMDFNNLTEALKEYFSQ